MIHTHEAAMLYYNNTREKVTDIVGYAFDVLAKVR